MSDFGDSMNGVYAEGVAELPTASPILDTLPSITATTLWNVGRVQNTMLGGSKQFKKARRQYNRSVRRGLSDGMSISDFMDPNAGVGGFFRQGFSNTFRPSRFRRFTRAAAIDPSAYSRRDRMYTPFQMSQIGNAVVSGNMSKLPYVGRFLEDSRLSRGQGRLAEILNVDTESDVPVFSSGLFGRIGVNYQLSNMKQSKFLKRREALASSLTDIGRTTVAASDLADPRAARLAVTGSVRSQVGGRVMGYIDVATEYKMAGGGEAGVKAAQSYVDDLAKIGNQSAREGGEKALAAAAKGGTRVLKYAPYTGAAAKAAGPLGTALMVKDAFKFIGYGIGGLIRTGLEAGQSIVGSIDKPIMGMGYRDNSVAATSRQRGVMAIQNSQLNARSMLGSEAAGLHAHFG